MAPGLMHQLGHLSALQGLDVHGFEGSATGYASHMPTPPLHPLSQCKQLRWLDISHWTVKESEVSCCPCLSTGRRGTQVEEGGWLGGGGQCVFGKNAEHTFPDAIPLCFIYTACSILVAHVVCCCSVSEGLTRMSHRKCCLCFHHTLACCMVSPACMPWCTQASFPTEADLA